MPLPEEGTWRVAIFYDPFASHRGTARLLLVPATASWAEDAKSLHAIALMHGIDPRDTRTRVSRRAADAVTLARLCIEARGHELEGKHYLGNWSGFSAKLDMVAYEPEDDA